MFKKEQTKWLGSETHCDMCNKEFSNFFYDAKVIHGSWGLLCEVCFKKYGIGLGVGRGQKYDVITKYKIDDK